MSFKVGQKVVFLGGNNIGCLNGLIYLGGKPKKNEIVTIDRFHQEMGFCHLILKEYPYDLDGYPQAFVSSLFRPLDFTEETIAMLEEHFRTQVILA